MKTFVLALMATVSIGFSSLAGAAKLTPVDYMEIEQLYAKYNHAIDGGDADAWAATFTADGVFAGRFTGTEQLKGFIKTWLEKMDGANRRHWNSNLKIEGTAEGANGSVYLILYNVGVKPVAIATTGMYTDTLVKTKAGWRFKTRAVKGDAPPAAPAAAPAPPAPEK